MEIAVCILCENKSDDHGLNTEIIEFMKSLTA